MRIAIISDIHEDVLSLKEALRQITKYNCDEIICLGDISGFNLPYYTYKQSRNASECLSLVRSNCKTVILGNHDLYAGSIIPENCTFFEFPQNWYELDYLQRRKLVDGEIWLHEEHDLNTNYTSKDIEYLKSYKEFEILRTNNDNILFSHYAFPNISGIKKEFFAYKFQFHPHFKFMDDNNCKISFISHEHTKGFYTVTKNKYKQYGYENLRLNDEQICVGLPPITGQQNRNGFAIFDLETQLLQIKKL